MPASSAYLVQRLCADLGGVARTRDLCAGEVSRRSLEAAVRSGDVLRLREGVYAHPDTSADTRTAVVHGGALGCISRAQEAGLWTLEEPSTLHVAMPKHGHFRVFVHEQVPVGEEGNTEEGCACAFHWGEVREHGGMQALPEALAAMVGCLGEEHFFVALESAMRKRLIDSAQLARLRAGLLKQHRWLVDFARWNADSGLESLLRLRLRSLGISLASQVEIPLVGWVDFVLGDRLIIEVDGKPNHAGVFERHKDLVRDAVAAAQGYDCVRFDYALVIHDWEKVEAAILAKVERRLHLDVRVGGRKWTGRTKRP